jgi:hypothetical protein
LAEVKENNSLFGTSVLYLFQKASALDLKRAVNFAMAIAAAAALRMSLGRLTEAAIEVLAVIFGVKRAMLEQRLRIVTALKPCDSVWNVSAAGKVYWLTWRLV